MSKNVVSFSMWGDDPLYCRGAIKNVKLVNMFYKGFESRYYCGSNVPRSTIKELESLGCNVIIETLPKNPDYAWDGLFWRFYAFEESGIVLSRDVDSRIGLREKAAVDSWIASNKDFHAMRDHIEHNVPILGGMFGVRKGILKNIRQRIENWGLNTDAPRYERFGRKGVDQDFLKTIWEEFRTDFIVHDKYPEGTEEGDYQYRPINFFGEHMIIPFPLHDPIRPGSFVGEVIKDDLS